MVLLSVAASNRLSNAEESHGQTYSVVLFKFICNESDKAINSPLQSLDTLFPPLASRPNNQQVMPCSRYRGKLFSYRGGIRHFQKLNRPMILFVR